MEMALALQTVSVGDLSPNQLVSIKSRINMRIKEGFVLRDIMGEAIVVGEGFDQINFNQMIKLNDSAAFLWRATEGRDFTEQELADLLTSHYEIDRESALADVVRLCEEWKKNGIIE